ncbi:MAG: helix-turn-helix domain-containing protein [bacterium]|nr:helix-turn-helix domain-containing protein [bacterium]
MKSAGSILREARVASEKTIEDISRITKIKEKFLQALEGSEWGSLPNFPIAQGFARNYAQAVGVNPSFVVALLRRDFPQNYNLGKTQEVSLKPQSFWTPKTTVIVVVFLCLLLFGAYLGSQYLQFFAPPSLKITQVEASGGKITVSGTTSSSATVEINGKRVLVGTDGSFSAQLEKEDLINSQVQVQAISRNGKMSSFSKRIDN